MQTPSDRATAHNLFSLFQSRFPDNLTHPLLELADGSTVSYGDMVAQTAQIAGALQHCGVTVGDRVAVQVEKSSEALFLYLACLRVGAIFLPLNTAYEAGEIAYFLGDAAPRLFVTDPRRADSLSDIASAKGVAHLLTLDADGQGSLMVAADQAAPVTAIAPVAADDIAAILYTSGTTGRSKGAMLSHGNLASNALTLHQAWGWQPGDVLLHVLPIFHVHGLFVASHCALLNGSTMLFLPRFDLDAVIARLPRTTVMMGVPTYYVRLLASDSFTRQLCTNMRLFVAGSAPLLADTFAAFTERTGHVILERYGMTEAGMICSNPYDGARLPGKVGPPLPGVQCRVADEDGAILDEDAIGVLEIAGPNVFKGYWRMPEKTAAEFRPDGWFITGDMAKIDGDGYVTIVGRAKDLIISGGLNVYPKEVESYIDALDGVQESAVIGLPHPDFGEAVCAVVVAAPNTHIDAETIISALKGSVAAFKVPKRVWVVDALPRNTMGKVQKNSLRATYESCFSD